MGDLPVLFDILRGGSATVGPFPAIFSRPQDHRARLRCARLDRSRTSFDICLHGEERPRGASRTRGRMLRMSDRAFRRMNIVKFAGLGPSCPGVQRLLSRVVGGPAIAVRDLVSANLGLNGRGYPSSDTGHYGEAPMLVNFRASKRLVWRHDPVRRVAIVLDLRHSALLHG